MSHYFISVGTSQLENKQLKLNARLGRLLGRVLDEDPTVDKTLAFTELEPPILVKLSSAWKNLSPGNRYSYQTNPFGAEITTLMFMEWRDGFKPADINGLKQNIYYLLRSDSTAGTLAGEVLYRFLLDVWEIPETSLCIWPVPGLHSHSTTIGEARLALNNFAVAIKSLLADSDRRLKDKQGQTRQFVMSGGFKSIIPVMDWFSLAYDIPLNYLFEKSDEMVQGMPFSIDKETRNKIKTFLDNWVHTIEPTPMDEA